MSETKNDTCILLATFNGEKYLKEQIESIINQTKKNWIMLVRDDGSSDETLQILNSYRKKDSRIKIINDSEPPTGSAEKNFAILVKKGLKTS